IEGRVDIVKANVADLPFDPGTFDVAVAFDTVNFWQDHEKAIEQIMRALKNGGRFFIINAYPKEGTKWYDFVKFKNDTEYKEFLSRNGLIDVDSVINKRTIIVWGRKENIPR
ncbi:MAG: class I SAM-dependent methyltransferase, partial [Clostridiales bacterium]|nr:class I SAM-dependent methyltransferase [Clostridiales bacterium]